MKVNNSFYCMYVFLSSLSSLSSLPSLPFFLFFSSSPPLLLPTVNALSLAPELMLLLQVLFMLRLPVWQRPYPGGTSHICQATSTSGDITSFTNDNTSIGGHNKSNYVVTSIAVPSRGCFFFLLLFGLICFFVFHSSIHYFFWVAVTVIY